MDTPALFAALEASTDALEDVLAGRFSLRQIAAQGGANRTLLADLRAQPPRGDAAEDELGALLEGMMPNNPPHLSVKDHLLIEHHTDKWWAYLYLHAKPEANFGGMGATPLAAMKALDAALADARPGSERVEPKTTAEQHREKL